MNPHSFLRLQLALTLFAAAFAPTAHADTPSKAEDWYTPKNGFETKTMEASYTGGKTTYTFEMGFFGDEGTFDFGWVDKIPNNDIATAIETAVQAQFTAARNEEKIEALGENLQSVLGASEITMNKTDPNGVTHSVKYQVANGSILNSIAQNGGLQLTDPTSSHNIADEKSLHWKTDNTMELNGWSTATRSMNTKGLMSDDYKNYLVPVNNAGQLTYIPLGGANQNCFTYYSGGFNLAGWYSATSTFKADSSIAQALSADTEEKSPLANYQVLVRDIGDGQGNPTLKYAEIGTLSDITSANPDLATIVTNAALGAAVDGALSLRGWTQALDNALPYKYSEGATLNWLSPPTKEGKAYYLGTDSAAKFGYHELIASSNATKVAGDNAAVTVTDIATDSTGTQVVSLKGWNNAYSSAANPLYPANVGGSLAYLPIALPEDTCTQKWDTVANWVGSTAKNEAKTLTLPQESLAEYLKKEHGMVYSTSENADLHFDTASSGIEASFNAPNNWADDSTIEVNESGKYALKVGDSCESTLSSLLSDPSSGTVHSFLALEESGDLHYVPLGAGITGGVQPDGVSIVSNETGLAIAGYANASTDTVLTRSANGVEWKSVTAECDGTTITTTSSTTDPKLTIVGFENANTNTVLMKSASGTLEWGAASGGGTIMGNTSDSVAVPISGAVFKSNESSDVRIKTEIIDGVPTITIGVYYK